MNGLKQPYQNKYTKIGRSWKLENKKLEITSEMKKIELKDFKDVYPIGIELDWMSIGGRIPESEDNLHLFNKFKTPQENPLQPSLRFNSSGISNAIYPG